MADLIEMKLTGLDGVLDTLKSLPPEVVSKRGGPVRSALRKGARVILLEAKARVPVDSGTLRDSLLVTRGKVDPGFKGEKYIIRAGGITMRQYVRNRRNQQLGRARLGDVKSYEVEDLPAVYGRFLEYGTSKMPARPWMRPAFAAKASLAISTIEKELLKSIERIVAKLGAANKGK